MSVLGGPDIVENGLILCYDPANIESYVSGSTTMYDLGSTGNTASLVGGVEYTGSFKGVFNFDGLNDYINIARPSSISTSGSFSVCMFAKWRTLGTTTSSIQTLLDNNHNSSPVQGFVLQDRPELSKKLSFSVRPDQVGATSSFYVGNNNWYHIAGTHDGTVSRLYINGVLDGFVSQSGGISTVQPNITFGRWQGSGGGRHLRGNIGQTLIYNRSLSLLEVQQNYNAVKGRYPSIAYTPDPYFENVTLLLRGDGENGGQNNTFIDSSANAFAITRNGNTTQGTFSPYGANWSNYFDGTGDLVRASVSSLSSTSFTIECWIFYSGATNSMRTIYDFAAAANGYGMFAYHSTGGNIAVEFFSSNATPYFGIISSSFSGKYNQWVHFAVSYDGSTYRMFLDGVSVGTPVSSATQVVALNTLTVGARSDTTGTQVWMGYISNFRYVTGAALYTATFTPDSSPLSVARSGTTRLLTCQSNRFVDNSSSPLTLTVAGNPSVQRFSPFSPTFAYDARTIGGSGYFDSSGDYLLTPANAAFQLGTGDFSIDLWYYPTISNTIARGLFGIGNDATGAIQLLAKWPFGGNPDNTLALNSTNVTTLVADRPFNLNNWNHIAISRASGVASVFLNGTRVINGSFTVNVTFDQLVIGREHTGKDQGYAVGYISDLRLVKGTALYSGTSISVPTSPLTAITNTSLLCNFTNAAIIDSAMMNNLETVAEAQVETVVTKFGTGAMEFDGSGDYLNFRVINQLPLNGDFTVELWFYARSSVTQRMFSLYASGTGASYYAGVRIDLNGGPGAFGLWSSDGGNHNIGTSQGSWSLNTWTHLAITRSGNTFRFFKDGTQFYTVDSSHGIMTGTSHTIGMLAGYNADYFNGFIDDFRVTRGVARYTSNFTPPVAALPDL